MDSEVLKDHQLFRSLRETVPSMVEVTVVVVVAADIVAMALHNHRQEPDRSNRSVETGLTDLRQEALYHAGCFESVLLTATKAGEEEGEAFVQYATEPG